eukprot:scaffold884_cov398-Prasinococcus_capsulatus_cf.AAC.26
MDVLPMRPNGAQRLFARHQPGAGNLQYSRRQARGVAPSGRLSAPRTLVHMTWLPGALCAG